MKKTIAAAADTAGADKGESAGTAEPSFGNEFISEPVLLKTILPVCRRTAKNLRDGGIIPFVQINGRILYHVPSVREALLRRQRGGVQ